MRTLKTTWEWNNAFKVLKNNKIHLEFKVQTIIQGWGQIKDMFTNAKSTYFRMLQENVIHQKEVVNQGEK